MHKGLSYILLVFGLVLAPLAVEAQQPAPKPGQPQTQQQRRPFDPRDTGPVPLLLRNRAELRLTADQVARLTEIDRQVEEKNRPFVTQLVEMRRQLTRPQRGREPTPEQRQAFEAQMRAAEPLLKSIDENWKTAMRQVGQVLTDEQKAKIPALVANERKSGERDDRRRGNARD
jgi:Spy/CpxP family protein refolding chaperone